MIINELANHVESIMLGLRAEYVRQPDRACQALDSFARYKMGGAAGLGISITQLVEHGEARFYRGLDIAPAVQDNSETRQHFANWADMKMPVVLDGTAIEQACGLTTGQLMMQDRSLGHSEKKDQLAFLNLIQTKYLAAATGAQSKKVTALWGNLVNEENPSRAYENLDDLFNEDGVWHGLQPSDLGSYPESHVWGREPLSNVGTDAEKKLRHRPIIVEVTTIDFDNINEVTMAMSLVVPGNFLAFMHYKEFVELAKVVLDKNDKVPLVTGSQYWNYDIQCVRINNFKIIPDPNMTEGQFRALHVGDNGMENGTFFPFYWDPMVNEVDEFAMLADKQIVSDMPAGMDFGYGRQLPWYGQEWNRSQTRENAIDTSIYLKSLYVCTERGFQLEMRKT